MKIYYFQGRFGLYYFRVVARNGKIVAASEGYNRLQACVKTAVLVRGANKWPIQPL